MIFLAQLLVCLGLVPLLKLYYTFLCLCFAQASQWLASVSVSMTVEFLPLTDKTVTMPFLLLNPHLCQVPSQETFMSV